MFLEFVMILPRFPGILIVADEEGSLAAPSSFMKGFALSMPAVATEPCPPGGEGAQRIRFPGLSQARIYKIPEDQFIHEGGEIIGSSVLVIQIVDCRANRLFRLPFQMFRAHLRLSSFFPFFLSRYGRRQTRIRTAPTETIHVRSSCLSMLFPASITTKDGTQLYYKGRGSGQPVDFGHSWSIAGPFFLGNLIYGLIFSLIFLPVPS
jgi:hypothetical protein